MGKGRVVDLHRDKGTGALACAVPASTDFSAGFGIAEQHAPVGCIVAVVRLSRDERHDNIEHEGPDLARETVLRGMKDADHHGLCSWLVVGEAADAPKPRQRRGWSGASRVRMGRSEEQTSELQSLIRI